MNPFFVFLLTVEVRIESHIVTLLKGFVVNFFVSVRAALCVTAFVRVVNELEQIRNYNFECLIVEESIFNGRRASSMLSWICSLAMSSGRLPGISRAEHPGGRSHPNLELLIGVQSFRNGNNIQSNTRNSMVENMIRVGMNVLVPFSLQDMPQSSKCLDSFYLVAGSVAHRRRTIVKGASAHP